MATTRRNILTILGLAPVATAVAASEDLDTWGASPGIPGLTTRGPEFQIRVAETLERMAAAIRTHELIAQEVELNSKVQFSEWMTHDFHVKVELPLTPGNWPT